jgi:tRNA pseudouridine32 synthase/23S rRNA pseudouridine746 synthase
METVAGSRVNNTSEEIDNTNEIQQDNEDVVKRIKLDTLIANTTTSTTLPQNNNNKPTENNYDNDVDNELSNTEENSPSYLPKPNFTVFGTIEIKYRDENILIISKPSGLLAVPGRALDNRICVATELEEKFGINNALIVHRLDQETSGLMMVALDKESHRHLSRQFQLQQISKMYTALVSVSEKFVNISEKNEGLIDLPLCYDPPNRPRHKVDFVTGKPSRTRWKIIQRFPERNGGVVLVELYPETGRSHQLRLHMLHTIGAIVGDSLYASSEVKAISYRLCLHATEITFTHPTTKETMKFISQPPTDW